MRAWAVEPPGPIDDGPLRRVERPVPEPGPRRGAGPGRARAACAGPTSTWPRATWRRHRPRRRARPRGRRAGRRGRPGRGRGSDTGERVGIAWLRQHLRALPVLPAGRREPVRRARASPAGTPTAATPSTRSSTSATPTGCPTPSTTAEAAPLLCAGIIGYRALRAAALPPGGRLGIYGFGGSAHLAAQVALHEGATVHVLTRAEEARRLALDLGAASAPGPDDAAARTARRRHPVRARRRAGAGGAAGPRPRRHARRRRHPSERHPAAGLRAPPVPGAPAAQRHRQHPPATARSSWRSPPASRCR